MPKIGHTKKAFIEYDGHNAAELERWIEAANGRVIFRCADGEVLIRTSVGALRLTPGESLVAHGEGMFYVQPAAVLAV